MWGLVGFVLGLCALSVHNPRRALCRAIALQPYYTPPPYIPPYTPPYKPATQPRQQSPLPDLTADFGARTAARAGFWAILGRWLPGYWLPVSLDGYWLLMGITGGGAITLCHTRPGTEAS